MILKAVLFSLLIKCFVGLFGYSGQGKRPMFGDYEAQRHWMEITYNIPVSEWYFDTKDNNLTYWGLDYPPLTGYHSWILGSIANRINPDFIKLNSSRGYESFYHKIFMRSTALASDLITYTLGIILFVKYGANKLKNRVLSTRRNHSQSLLYISLIYPGLILIDHGHFQYNCVSLGFVVISCVALICDHDVLSSIFYCLSFSYKQMSLYYSFPYFVYFLGKFVRDSEKSISLGFANLIKISFTVIITLAIAWFPFITSLTQLFQVLHRIFPFYRGIFDDKVANFWCVLNVFYKLKNIDNDRMAFFCTIIVIVSTMISCINLLLNPEKDKFLLSLINSSLAFFLFSFQVHEKSILLVALPVLLNLFFKPLHCCWFLFLSMFSMTPLLQKDGVIIPLSVLTFIFLSISHYFYRIFNKKSLIKELTESKLTIFNVYYYIYILSFVGCFILGTASLIIPPPLKYPDLFPLLISFYSAFHFLYFLLFFNYNQIVLKSKKTIVTNKKRK